MVKTFPYKQTADKLRSLRGQQNVEHFAKKLDINIRTYYRYESGEREIHPGLLRLAEKMSEESIRTNGHQKLSNENQEEDSYVIASEMLLKIFKSKSATKYRRAIMSNLEAFSESIKAEDRIAHLENEVAELKLIVQQQTRASTDRRQTPGENPEGRERRSGDDRRGRPIRDNGGGI